MPAYYKTVPFEAPLSMGFPRQEYWGGLLFSPLRDVPDPGIKPMSPALEVRFFTSEGFNQPPAVFWFFFFLIFFFSI